MQFLLLVRWSSYCGQYAWIYTTQRRCRDEWRYVASSILTSVRNWCLWWAWLKKPSQFTLEEKTAFRFGEQDNLEKVVKTKIGLRFEWISERAVSGSWSCSQALSKPVWHIPLLRLRWKTPDDGQRNCPKYVEFYSKNKFEKLVHLDGFIIRIYHDARSPERQIINLYLPEFCGSKG